jgi:hypothetical protein
VSSPALRHQPSLNGFSSTLAAPQNPSIRRIRAGRRQSAIVWSDRFVLFVTTPATLQGRAGVGLRHQIAASICAHQPGLSLLQRFRC